MLSLDQNRIFPWGQIYHWELNENGKLTFVSGLVPQSGVELSLVNPNATD